MELTFFAASAVMLFAGAAAIGLLSLVERVRRAAGRAPEAGLAELGRSASG
jgi:hypothetical protein